MYRLIWTLLILSVSLYADGSCNCPPSVIVTVNDHIYSSSFVPITTDNGVSYTIAGTITNETPDSLGQTYDAIFTFSLNVTTHPDPDIDFDTSISGDPTVGIRITQTFLGGPLFNLTTASSGFIENLSNLSSSEPTFVSGFQRTTVGDTVIQQNIGCTYPNLPLFQTTPCNLEEPPGPQQILIPNENPFIPLSGVLIMDIGFVLSDHDKFTLNGNATLTPIPEPAAMIPLMAGMFAMAGIAWRRNRNRIATLQ